MNGANKGRQLGWSVLTWTLTIALNTGCFCLGLLLRGKIPFAAQLSGLCLGVTLLLSAIGPIVTRRYAKQVDKSSVREINADMDQRRQATREDPRRALAHLRRVCALSIGYTVLAVVLCLSVPFFKGMAAKTTVGMVENVIALFALSGFVGRLIVPKEKDSDVGLLPEADFPLLYGMFREAAGPALSGKELRICILDDIPNGECTAAVAVNEKRVILLLGVTLLCVADEEELHQVMLHEAAHLDSGEVKETKTVKGILNYLGRDSRTFFGFFADNLLVWPLTVLSLRFQMYDWFVSQDKEAAADRRAAQQGDAFKQASILAKIGAHELYIFEQEPYTTLFASEKIPQHLLSDRARAFRQALTEREGDWRRILEHGLVSRTASHPTFRLRWEALGCCPYSLTPADENTAFAQECWAAAEAADAVKASVSQERYDAMRKEAYLDQLKIVEEFESRNRELTPDELRPPMLAYYAIGKPEKMEEICDRVIRDNESPFATAFSKYWKGVLLLRRYDDRGLEYIYQAMETNSNYIRNGLDEIGSYCCRMGLEKALEEYRALAPELLQTDKDRTSDGITLQAKLTTDTLPEGWQDQILKFILDAAAGSMEAVYLVRNTIREDYAPSTFILRFRDDTAEEKRDEVLDKVFRLLDDWPVDWEFYLYAYENSMRKPLSRVAGSCIWSSREEENGKQ